MLERLPPTAEEPGRASKVRLTQILQDTLAGGILLIDEHGEIVACSPEAERIVGLSQADLQQRSIRALPAALQAIIKESLTARLGLPSRWIMTQLPHEAERPMAVRTQFLQGPNGSAWIAVVLSDPTTVIALESRLQRLNRLASGGMLSASLAHEIKNTLVAIKTFVDTLVEQHRDLEVAQLAGRELDRIHTIVGQMLRFSGTAPVKRVRVDLHDVLDQTLRLSQHEADERRVKIERAFSAKSSVVSGDTYQLEQAFINLFLNALAAMAQGGELRVTTEDIPGRVGVPNSLTLPEAGWTRISVADSGCGMPAEVLERVFEPFFTTKPDGTGLGLSITRRIVHEHGGHISVESRPGLGTRFTIELPPPEDGAVRTETP